MHIAPWGIVTAMCFWPARPDAPPVAADHGRPADGDLGPWGRLTLVPIVISPPPELVSTDWGGARRPTWFFPGVNADQVVQMLQAAGVPAGEAARFRSEARSEPRIA